MKKSLSLIIPVKNESKNIPELYDRLKNASRNLGYEIEIIFIDDGSSDDTVDVIKDLAKKDAGVKAISLRKNFGKNAALSAGFEYAKGNVLMIMDGDLQHEPEEIPHFIEKIEAGYDIVTSWRHKRRDNFLTRRIPSLIANKIMAWISGVKLHDFGGTFQAYRRDVLDGLELYSDLFRFIPALVSSTGNYKIYELPINNPSRKFGKSNYGLGRIFGVLFDLLTVKYFISYISRSLQFFGAVGLFFIGAGAAGTGYLLFKKVFLGTEIFIIHGPLFITSIFCLLVGVQIVIFGILSEVLTRIYFKTNSQKPYRIKELVNLSEHIRS